MLNRIYKQKNEAILVSKILKIVNNMLKILLLMLRLGLSQNLSKFLQLALIGPNLSGLDLLVLEYVFL